jgi:hypothetical protein
MKHMREACGKVRLL